MIKRYYLFQFLTGLHFFGGVLVPFFTEWGGISLSEAQALQAWFAFCVFLFETPTGVIADRFGRKYSLAIGGLFSVCGCLIYGSYPHIVVFAIGEALLALATACFSGADSALIFDHLVDQGKKDMSTQIFARARMIHMMGIGAAAPLGSLLGAHLGLNTPMLLTAIPGLIGTVLALSFTENRVRDGQQKTSYKAIVSLSARSVLKQPHIVSIILNSVLIATSAYFVIWLYQPMMMNLGADNASFGFAHSFLVVCQMVILLKLQNLVSRSLNLYLILTGAVVAISLIIAAILPSYWTLGLMLILAGGFGLTRSEAIDAYINEFIDADNRATTNSLISMARRLTIALANPIVGSLSDHSISLSLVFVGLLAMAATAIFMRFHKTK